jgi:hypothetical protein
MSAHRLHRMLGVTYKTAWFMLHSIPRGDARACLHAPPVGHRRSQADETHLSGKRRDSGTGRGTKNKTPS